MVEPTYFLACPVFEDAGFHDKMRGVPEDEQGIDIEYLRKSTELAEHEVINGKALPTMPDASGTTKTYRHIIYTVPTFSNPSAKVLTVGRRQELVRLAREFDALFIADDVNDWLRWPAECSVAEDALLPPVLPRLVDIDRSMPGSTPWGYAVSNGSPLQDCSSGRTSRVD